LAMLDNRKDFYGCARESRSTNVQFLGTLRPRVSYGQKVGNQRPKQRAREEASRTGNSRENFHIISGLSLIVGAVRRKPGLATLHRSALDRGEWRLWAARVERPKLLDFNRFSDSQSIFKLDTQVSYGTVHLCMSQQELNGAQVARLLVNLGDLRAPH